MPYLYTLAEEASRTGLPLVRPLFLEFPDAAPDHHPLDVDIPAAAEFLLGPDLLIAPPPYPDEIQDYPVTLPTQDWYDFWTGAKVPQPSTSAQPFTVSAHPGLATLPVFVRGGSILPIEPLVQGTNQTPQGSLTLRIYAGDPGENAACGGSLYLDDGKTMAYRQGAFLRMSFTCSESDGTLHIHIGQHQGTYPAWWKQIRAEVYGWNASSAVLEGNVQPIRLDRSAQSIAFTIDDTGKGIDVDLK
jgi:alpha-glucosidase